MTRIKKAKAERNYTTLQNETIRDSRLSYKARGLLCYMLSMSNDWIFYVSDLVNKSTKDGKSSVNSGLKELSDFGYLLREQKRSKDGKFSENDWLLYEVPQKNICSKPSTDFPSTGKQSTEKPTSDNRPLRSTNYKNTKYKNNNYINHQSPIAIKTFDLEKFKQQIKLEEITSKDSDGLLGYIVSVIFEVMKQKDGVYKINGLTRQVSEVQEIFVKATNIHIENVGKDIGKVKSKIKNKRSYIISSLFNEILSNQINKRRTEGEKRNRVETVPYWAEEGFEFKEQVVSEEKKKELEDFKQDALKRLRSNSSTNVKNEVKSTC
ncbi:hypothetical protein [Enterococcus faecalis]|uniref:hypothetical protein n=1 Tax=Enterococcus faecalis TaxID=1351 RepID=UPI0039A5F285